MELFSFIFFSFLLPALLHALLLYCVWLVLGDSEPESLAQRTLESSAARERLAGYIFMCGPVGHVLFSLAIVQVPR